MATCSWWRLHRADRLPRAGSAIGVTAVPLALFIVLLIAMVFTALYGWAIERIAYRPLRGSFRLAPLISAIGMSIFLQNFVQVTQGARVKPMPPLITGDHTLIASDGFAVQISYMQIIIGAHHAGAAGGVFLAGREDAARPRTCAPASRTRRWRRCSASTSTAPSR